MVDRSVVVRLIADNASFNTAMAQSANAVGGIGKSADQASGATVAAFGRMKTAAVALVGVAALKTGQDLLILKENAQSAFTIMLGGAERARAKIAEIEAFSKTTVIGLDKWIGGAQLLTAYGIEAEKLVPILQNIADAAAGSGQGAVVVDRIVLALGQIQSKGRVMAQEMLQLTEAGIPAWKLLAKAMGVDMLTAQKMGEKGLIDSKTALDALSTGIEELYGGAAAGAVNTLGGSISTFKVQMQEAGAAAIQPLVGIEKQALHTGGAILTAVGGGIGSVLTMLSPAINLAGGFIELIGKLPDSILAGAAALGVMALMRDRLNRGNAWIANLASTKSTYRSTSVEAERFATVATASMATANGAAASHVGALTGSRAAYMTLSASVAASMGIASGAWTSATAVARAHGASVTANEAQYIALGRAIILARMALEGTYVRGNQLAAGHAVAVTAAAGSYRVLGLTSGTSTAGMAAGFARANQLVAGHTTVVSGAAGGYSRLTAAVLAARAAMGTMAAAGARAGSAISSGMATAAGAVGRAGASALSFFGGPLGLAIVGATVAMSIWGNANQKAKEAEQEHQAQLVALKDSLDQVSGATTGATTARLLDDWSKIGEGQSVSPAKMFEDLGSSAAEASAAVRAGGPALDAYREKLAVLAEAKYTYAPEGLVLALLKGGDAVGQFMVETSERTGQSLETVQDHLGGFISTGQIAKDGITGMASAFASSASGIAAGSAQIRQTFDDTARSAAILAGVSGDDVVAALTKAKESGGSVEEALEAVGIKGSAATTVIDNLGSSVMQGAGEFHVMAGAAQTGAAGIEEITSAATAAGNALKSAVADAQAYRAAVMNAVTSFVNPVDAWGTAKTRVNEKPEEAKRVAIKDDPAVKAAADAQKAGQKVKEAADKAAKAQQDAATKASAAGLKLAQKAKDAAMKSAKAEKDAAVDAAKAAKKSIDDRAKADQKLTKDAESAAQKRIDVAKKEADEYKKLADERKKAADDAKDTLDEASFRAQAADTAVAAAKLARGSADGSNRAQWELAYNAALKEQKAAYIALGTAKEDNRVKTEQSTEATKGSETASRDVEQAEKDLAKAKEASAAAAEDSSARQEAAAEALQAAQDVADEKYQAAQEAADLRYEKAQEAKEQSDEQARAKYEAAQEASQEKYQALLDTKSLAEEAARKSTEDMASKSSAAVAGMADDIEPSLAEWRKALEEQKKKQAQWVLDMQEISKKVPADVAAYLLELGPSGAAAVKEMNAGSKTELDAMVPLIRASMPAWNGAIVESLLAGIPGAKSALAQLGDEGLAAMLAELNTADADVEAIFEKYGVKAQQTVNQWGAIVWNFDVNTNYAESKMQEFFTRNQNKYGSPGKAPNTYDFNSGSGYANGGWIRGGSGTRDDLPIMAMGGEFMVKKSAARKHASLLERINGGGDGYDLPVLTAVLPSANTAPMPIPAPAAAAGPRIVINMQSYNAVAEPDSIALNKAMAAAAVMDGLG